MSSTSTLLDRLLRSYNIGIKKIQVRVYSVSAEKMKEPTEDKEKEEEEEEQKYNKCKTNDVQLISIKLLNTLCFSSV